MPLSDPPAPAEPSAPPPASFKATGHVASSSHEDSVGPHEAATAALATPPAAANHIAKPKRIVVPPNHSVTSRISSPSPQALQNAPLSHTPPPPAKPRGSTLT